MFDLIWKIWMNISPNKLSYLTCATLNGWDPIFIWNTISWYVFLTRGDSTNIAPAYRKWFSQGLHWNQSLWTLMPDVILWGEKWFRNFKIYVTLFTSHLMQSASQAYPCFHAFDQKEKQFTLFHFRGSVKWKQNKGESVERAKDRERWETVGC